MRSGLRLSVETDEDILIFMGGLFKEMNMEVEFSERGLKAWLGVFKVFVEIYDRGLTVCYGQVREGEKDFLSSCILSKGDMVEYMGLVLDSCRAFWRFHTEEGLRLLCCSTGFEEHDCAYVKVLL